MSTCIFCRRDSTGGSNIEHILPVALGGRDDFVLSDGEVCTACNTRVGRADQALVEYCRPLLPYAHVTRRDGRHHSIDLGNVRVTRNPTEVHVEVRPGAPGQASPPRVSRTGSAVQVSYDLTWHSGGKLERGLHKIAFELACKEQGPAFVLHRRFDDLRDYIRGAMGGFRNVLMDVPPQAALEDISHGHGTMYITPLEGRVSDYLVFIRLVGLQFYVAVSPDIRAIRELGSRRNAKAGRRVCITFDAASRTQDP